MIVGEGLLLDSTRANVLLPCSYSVVNEMGTEERAYLNRWIGILMLETVVKVDHHGWMLHEPVDASRPAGCYAKIDVVRGRSQFRDDD